MIRAAALTITATLTVAACALTATRPADNNGTTPDTTTTTLTVPLAPLPDQQLTATVAAPAVRHEAIQIVTPPTPPTTVALTGCAEMRAYRIAVGLPDRFDGIGWRESNCRNEDSVRTFCCHGWWQLYVSLHLQDHRLVDAYHTCGVYHHTDINSDTPGDKQRAACATKALYDEMGYQPWSATA